MPEGEVLEFSGVTKRFGAFDAVSGFSARVEPGVVTGFLGPNGAGKTTTMRILLGLVRATDGRATIGGSAYRDLAHPMRTVGAVLEAASFHPGRSAANHLKVYAQAGGVPLTRVDEALAAVGLTEVAGRKVGGFSLGMRQRLGLAGALLGDPGVLVLDEPTNGLDPEGIIWMRSLLRDLARQGRTVFVSSHLLSEIQQTVDRLVIISRGRLVFQGDVDELSDASDQAVLVDGPDRAQLADALTASGTTFDVLRSGLSVRGADPADIGRIALSAGVALSALQRKGPTLEEVFLDLVNGVRVHPSAAGDGTVTDTGTGAGAETVEGDGRTPEQVDADAATAAEVSAELDAIAGASPAAAAAGNIGAAVGRTGSVDVVPPEDDESAEPEAADAEPEAEHAEPETEPEAAEPEAAEPEAADAEPEAADASDVEIPDAPVETASAHRSYSVASTGVIDIVHDTADTPDADTADTPDADTPDAEHADHSTTPEEGGEQR